MKLYRIEWCDHVHMAPPSRHSASTYKLTLPLLFHVSVQPNMDQTLFQRNKNQTKYVEFNGKEEWEVDNILNCRRHNKNLPYQLERIWDPEQLKQTNDKSPKLCWTDEWLWFQIPRRSLKTLEDQERKARGLSFFPCGFSMLPVVRTPSFQHRAWAFEGGQSYEMLQTCLDHDRSLW